MERFFKLAQKFDLLGHPIPENHGKQGRDGYVPTPEISSKIRSLLANGLGKKAVAEKMGLSTYILNAHYLNRVKIKDLQKTALVEARAANLLRLETAADKGNVAAMKELMRIYTEAEVEMIERELGASPKASKPEKPGKKEMETQTALDADEDLMRELEEESKRGYAH